MNGVWLEVASGPVARAVVPRVITVLGAQADLPVDRIQACVRTVDAMLAHINTDRVIATTALVPGGIEVFVGPASPGSRATGDAVRHPDPHRAVILVLDDTPQ